MKQDLVVVCTEVKKKNIHSFFYVKDHYDFSVRAVKMVISVAGNLRREHPNLKEVTFFLLSRSKVSK